MTTFKRIAIEALPKILAN